MRHPAEWATSRGPGLAARVDGMDAQKLPPIVTTAIAVLLLSIIGFWGYAATDPEGFRIAHISRTRARLNDAACVFSADVMLNSRVHQWAFQRRQPEVKAAL